MMEQRSLLMQLPALLHKADIPGIKSTARTTWGNQVFFSLKDLPKNVSFKFAWLSPFKIYEDQNTWLQQWGNNGVVTYVIQTQTSTTAIATIDLQLPVRTGTGRHQ